MGEEIRGVPEGAALAGKATGERGSQAPAAIGAYLAAQRRLRGISVDELAGLTKIPRRSIERLESGAFDGASDGFVRGFVRTLAAALGLDADETVMRLASEPAPDEETGPWAARRPWLVLAAAAAALALLSLSIWGGVQAWRAASGEAASESGVVLRRDAVRDLARERAGAPAAP